MSKYLQEKFPKNPKNRIVIDYLTVNFRDMLPEQVIDLLCSFSNEDVVKDAFIYNDMGAITSYNRSYRFLNERFITINWRSYVDSLTGEVIELDERQGVSLNITGTGCRFFSEKDFFKFLVICRKHDAHFTRIDIAFDDFNEVIPCEEMIHFLQSWNGYCDSTISTNVRYGSMRLYMNVAMIDGQPFSAFNFELGSNGSERQLRLYDKKIEQQRSDVDYWKRLELQLRRKKANEFIDFYLSYKNLFIPFSSFLYDFVRFLKPNDYSRRQRSLADVVDFYTDFIDYLRNFTPQELEDVSEQFLKQIFWE